MNILMFTNTYLPHVGGVARSVELFARHDRMLGHSVLVVAPTYEGVPAEETDVVRVPSVQQFNRTEFSLPISLPGALHAQLDEFQPQIVHSHHPFLLGNTALRVAAARSLPIVFTHHTRYETYTHYLPLDSPAIQRGAARLAAAYCNLCDAVIAPSQSIADVLRHEEVTASIEVIPTGVEVERFSHGFGRRARSRHGIPQDALVVGHVGRLAPEKNLAFLAEAVAAFVHQNRRAHFFVIGVGPAQKDVLRTFAPAELPGRLHLAGILESYESLIERKRADREIDDSPWSMALRWLDQELKIVSAMAGVVGETLTDSTLVGRS